METELVVTDTSINILESSVQVHNDGGSCLTVSAIRVPYEEITNYRHMKLGGPGCSRVELELETADGRYYVHGDTHGSQAEQTISTLIDKFVKSYKAWFMSTE